MLSKIPRLYSWKLPHIFSKIIKTLNHYRQEFSITREHALQHYLRSLEFSCQDFQQLGLEMNIPMLHQTKPLKSYIYLSSNIWKWSNLCNLKIKNFKNSCSQNFFIIQTKLNLIVQQSNSNKLSRKHDIDGNIPQVWTCHQTRLNKL